LVITYKRNCIEFKVLSKNTISMKLKKEEIDTRDYEVLQAWKTLRRDTRSNIKSFE
jgi:hypothetical protein